MSENEKEKDRVYMKAGQIAKAFILVAQANHYMVQFCHAATLTELEQAKQILIAWSNSVNNKDVTLELALDLIEREIKGAKI